MNTHKNRFRVVVVLVVTLGGCAPVSHVTGWKSLPEILSRIKAPEFPTRDFVITDYGAVAGGSNDCTATIAKAIDACHAAGGGRVVVPDGVFLTGAIHLKSNVNLHLADGATLKFSADPAQYLPVVFTRWEGVEGMNYSALIYAFEQKNIAITGKGVLDGSASSENWWAWTRRDPNGEPAPARRSRDMLNDMGERGVPVEQRVFGQGHFLRPNFVQPYRCRNVLIEGVTIRNSPMWELNPVLCSNVTVRGVTISSHGPNNDGCDPESCRDVLIEDCIFDTGDDCIAIKSGRGSEAYALLKTTEDVRITNCTFADSIFACIGIGSETSGGIRNVRIEHCKFTHAQTYAIYVKSRPGRGAFIEDIVASDLDVSGVRGGFLRFNILNSGIQDQAPVPGDEGIPTIKNFRFSNVRVTDCPILVDGTGIHPHKPLEGFSLVNVTGTCAKGISLANVKKAEIRNIKVTGYSGPLIDIHNVTGKGLEGAAIIEAPKVPDPIPAPAQPYQLH